MSSRVVSLSLVGVLLLSVEAFCQTDPGPRAGAPGAGGPLASVAADNPSTILSFFNDGKDRFEEIDSVSGAITGEDGFGLGPRYNSRSCAACHAEPATGGSSPATNPQVADATADGATNTVPSFITSSGPVREARFIFFMDAFGVPITTAPNGGVEDLYTIAGRSDASTCTTSFISQPDFANAIEQNNVIFRIPTPVFGAGLVENVDESDLLANQASIVGNGYGIAGTFNRNGNDGTISRFGWKAQNKSLEIFSGEAYNVEMGVSNELFTNERPLPEEDRNTGLAEECKLNGFPEDHTNFNTTAVKTPSDAVQFAMFMRLLAPPSPKGVLGNGRELFDSVGCTSCHSVGFTTHDSRITPDLGQASFEIFSDLEVHHMGDGLADNITQGDAGGDQFRTAPLWGIGQRRFFLHDGRTSNIVTAITQHSSTGSEANTVIANYSALTTSQKQFLINFLRSL